MTINRPAHPSGPTGETPGQRQARRAVQLERDLAVLTAGGETGWWDEHGIPAPWPADFFDAHTEWRPHIDNPPAPSEQLL